MVSLLHRVNLELVANWENLIQKNRESHEHIRKIKGENVRSWEFFCEMVVGFIEIKAQEPKYEVEPMESHHFKQ